MANQEDIDRHRRGKDAWNEWAEKNPETSVDFSSENMINNFVGFIFPGDAYFAESQFRNIARFVDAEFRGDANFTGASFQQGADFNNAKFLGTADFTNAKFHNHCSFSNSTFSDHAIFAGARFNSLTNFSGSIFGEGLNAEQAKFSQAAVFKSIRVGADLDFSKIVAESDFDLDEIKVIGSLNLEATELRGCLYLRSSEIDGLTNIHRLIVHKEAFFGATIFAGLVQAGDTTFSSDASFFECTFGRNLDFSQSEFAGRTNFENSKFNSNASFNAIGSKGPFSFADARFLAVPDFGQASFRAPPRLDNIDIPRPATFKTSGNREVAARYRALKRLAVEGHDHLREQQFFTGEIIEQRGNDDKPFGPNAARYWFGYGYGLISNFGRSIMRPIGWCFGLWALFTFIYLVPRNLSAWQKCGPDGLLPICKAAYFSFVNSMPLIGLGKTEQIKLVSNCLYGSPNLPFGVTILTTIQTLLSTVLIFLFLLAVRNHFRIK